MNLYDYIAVRKRAEQILKEITRKKFNFIMRRLKVLCPESALNDLRYMIPLADRNGNYIEELVLLTPFGREIARRIGISRAELRQYLTVSFFGYWLQRKNRP